MKNSPLPTSFPLRAFLIAGILLAAPGPGRALAASDGSASDPIVTVQSYIEAFNKADVEAMAANFAVPGFILDGMPPHVWHGPNATRDWFRDGQAMARAQKVTEERIVLTGKPLHKQVTGTNAYVVVPASFTYKMNGRLVSQTGARFTIALTQVGGAWRIASWAWTKGTTDGTPAF